MTFRIGMRTAGLLGAAATMGFGLRAVTADGIPQDSPLTYAGTLTEAGAPITGQRSISVALWRNATAQAAESPACVTGPAPVTVQAGRFRVPLAGACKAAINAERDLWVEVVVASSSLGRQKLGAVPYAVEAERASAASGALADSVTQLTQRLAALEQQMAEARLKTLETSALQASSISLNATEAGAWAEFARMCIADINSGACQVAANRKCVAMGFKLGVYIGEGTAASGVRSAACLR